ncbi:MAG: NfeD family protein [Alistipes sp.]|nr:NfeD family protein [Alistipes sp.]
MDIWIYWVIAALLLFIVELFTSGFAVICLAIGALGGAVAALLEWSLEYQFLAFAIVSLIALIAVRPVLKRLLFNKGEKVQTNVDAIIGKRGVVCVDVEQDDDNGRVMIDGLDWRAKSVDNEPLPKGTKVEVVDRDSVILTVKKL